MCSGNSIRLIYLFFLMAQIMCKVGVNADQGMELQSLFHLIPSYFDKETVVIILEQVLLLMPPYPLVCYFFIFFS